MSCYAKNEQPPQVKTYRAALYIRLSREDGDKAESDSVINQKRLLTHFAQAQPDIESYQYYVDDGWSGANFDRPDFTRMMEDVYARNIDCVIVKDSSRFGRNASESGRYIGEVFPRLRVRYIAVNDAIDSGRSQGVAIDFLNNSMRGMINEYYVAANSESIRSTLDMERKRGYFIGSFAKYGYKKDPADHHKLLIDEDATEVVRQIYRMYLSGSGIRTIVRTLNEKSIPNPSTYKCSQGLNFRSRAIGKSSLWSDKTVRRILQDEMYIGHMVQGKNKKVSYKGKAVIALPQEEWIRVEDTHEAIVCKDDFDRVQIMLSSHTKSSPVSGEVDLFSGLLKCADCGHALIKKANRNPNKIYIYYRCSSHCKCKTACSAHTIRYEKLYDAVLVTIRKMVDIAVNADEVIRETRKQKSSAERVDAGKQIKAQEQELEKVKQFLADLYPDYKNGILNKEQYLMNKQKMEQEEHRLTQSIKRLKTASSDQSDSNISENEFINHFKKCGNIDRLTRPMLTELVDRIVVNENGDLEIIFNFRDAFADMEDATRTKSA